MTQMLPNMVFYILIRQSTPQPLKSHDYELISDVCVASLHAHIRYSIELQFKKGLSVEAVPPHT